MSARNKKLVMNFMDEFVKGNKQHCQEYLTEDIRLNIVGMPAIAGKQNVLQAMEMMALWKSSLLNCSPVSEKEKNIIAEKDFVVVEGIGAYDKPANCDVYRILDGKIREVTSYIVDTSVNE